MLNSPLTALIRREFISQIRGVRSYALMVLFVAVCVVAVSLGWPAEERLYASSANLSRELVMAMAFLLLGACLLFVPALGATSIVVEREEATLDMLRMTLIRPSGMLLGKLVNTAGFFMLLFVAVIPVLATSFFLLGLDWLQISQALAILITTAFSCAMVGILSSAFFQRTFTAIIMSYLGVLALLGSGVFLRIPVTILSIAGVFASRSFIGFGPFGWSPIGALGAAFDGSLPAAQFVMALFSQALFVGACFVLALAALRRSPRRPRLESFRPIDDPRILQMRRRTWPFYLVDPLARKKPIEDRRNPMMVRELRWGLATRATFLLRLFLFSFIIWFCISVPVAFERNQEGAEWWFMVQMVVMVVVAPAFVSNAMTKEYEQGNIDMLRMTLLRPREIILGKVASGFFVISPLIFASVLACVAFAVMLAFDLSLFVPGYVTLLLCATVSVSFGLVASMLTKRSIVALVFSYLLNMLVFFGPVVLRFLFDVRVLDRTEGLLSSCVDSPIVVFLQLGSKEPTATWWAWTGNVLFYSAVAMGALWWSIRRFESRRLRDD